MTEYFCYDNELWLLFFVITCKLLQMNHNTNQTSCTCRSCLSSSQRFPCIIYFISLRSITLNLTFVQIHHAPSSKLCSSTEIMFFHRNHVLPPKSCSSIKIMFFHQNHVPASKSSCSTLALGQKDDHFNLKIRNLLHFTF